MRTKNSILNAIAAFLGQCLSIIIGLISRTVLISTLGITILGLNGLFTNIISMLSLAELGIGTAIAYNLYKPIAENNIKEVNMLLRFYAMIYRTIGVLIFIIGIGLLPFLKYFTEGVSESYAITIFLLFVINASISYFFSYKRTIIFVNQKNYIITSLHYLLFIILNIIQIILLLLYKNFVLYLLLQICFTLLENLLITVIANKLYPYIKVKSPYKLERERVKKLFLDVKAAFLFKFGRLLISNGDLLVISTFLDLALTGIYSNYILLIGSVTSILTQIFNAAAASIGNLSVLSDKDKKNSVFLQLVLINSWFISLSTVCILVLINPFIRLWIGEKFLLDTNVIILFSLVFFLNGTRLILNTFRDSMGLFRYLQYRPVFEAILNIMLSIILVNYFGITGVLLGTAISSFVFLWFEPQIMYKYILNSSIKEYIARFILAITCTTISSIICYSISLSFNYSILDFIYRILLCLIVPNLVFFLTFRNIKEFSSLVTIIVNVFRKVNIKIKESFHL